MEPDAPNLFLSLPYDIIHEICSYLPSNDFQSLKLVCKPLLSNLPPSRLNQRQRTVFYDRKEIYLLKELAASDRDRRNRISRIVLDLASPRVKWRHHRVAKYPNEGAGVWDCLEYNPWALGLLVSFGGYFKQAAPLRLLKWLLDKARDEEEEAQLNFLDEGVGMTLLGRLYIHSTVRKPRPTISKIESPGVDEFFQVLEETLGKLPNLRSLEIRSNINLTNQHLTSFWKRYNPHISSFFLQNPSLEAKIPWSNYFEVLKPRPNVNETLHPDQAYLGLLSSAAKAGCRITEVLVNNINLVAETFHNGAPSRYIQQFTFPPHVDKYAGLFKSAFENLVRLEIPIELWGGYGHGWTEECNYQTELSLALMGNVEELCVVRACTPIWNQGFGTVWANNLRQIHWDFWVPDDLLLGKLRKLEIVELGIIEVENLLGFLKKNSKTLRRLRCSSTFNRQIRRSKMIEILTFLKNELELEYCQIDFMTNKVVGKVCFLCIEVDGRFGVDGECGYKIGTKCVSRSMEEFEKATEKEPMSFMKPKWKTVETWDGFLSGIEEIGTKGVCTRHWQGDLKPGPPVFCYVKQ